MRNCIEIHKITLLTRHYADCVLESTKALRNAEQNCDGSDKSCEYQDKYLKDKEMYTSLLSECLEKLAVLRKPPLLLPSH